VISKFASVIEQIEKSSGESSSIVADLSEYSSSHEKIVKGLKQFAKDIKEEGPALEKVGKSGNFAMIASTIGMFISGAVLALMMLEDKTIIPTKIDTVNASVDGIYEQLDLVSGRIFEQQSQMDAVVAAVEELKSFTPPAAPYPPASAEVLDQDLESDTVADSQFVMAPAPVVSVDLSVIEAGIAETQIKIAELQKIIEKSEANLSKQIQDDLKIKHKSLVEGHNALQLEQDKMLQLQQDEADKKVNGKQYKFP
jgi:hypothetical protein